MCNKPYLKTLKALEGKQIIAAVTKVCLENYGLCVKCVCVSASCLA